MLIIFLQILPLFIIITFGWLLTKFNVANQSWLKPIGDFALYIGFPALIFGNLTVSKIDFNLVGDSFFRYSSLLLGVLFIFLLLINFITKSKTLKATYLISLLFGNAAFLGIPLLVSIDSSLSQIASLNAAVMLFWVFSIGLFIVERYTLEQPNTFRILKNLIKNPLLLSVLFGFLFNFLEIRIPEFIHLPIEMLGYAVSPMVMLMIGVFIAIHPPKSPKDLKLPLVYSFFKLLFFPFLGLITFYFLSKEIEISAITQFAMPAAITPFVLAERYRLNKEFICNSIIVSTILSLITIPTVINIIDYFNDLL